MDTLTDANKELEEVAKADQQVEKTDDKDSVSNRREDENIADTDGKVKVAEDEDIQDNDVADSGTDASVISLASLLPFSTTSLS